MDVKKIALRLAKYSGLFALARRVTAAQPRILAYHGIWLGEAHFGNFLYMSAATFARRMALLQQWRYPVVTLAAATQTGSAQSLPACATVITIDDGWYGTYAEMLPVLERHGFPATIYLTTYYCLQQAPVIDVALQYAFARVDGTRYPALTLPAYQLGPLPLTTAAERQAALTASLDKVTALHADSERQALVQALYAGLGLDYAGVIADRRFHLMTPAQVADAAARGCSIELHTHRHRISHAGQDCLDEEIAINRDHIKAMTGREPVHFCYPSGRFTPSLWPTLAQAGIASATTTDIGLVAADAPPYALPRILDGQDITDLEFEAELCGFMELLRRLRR